MLKGMVCRGETLNLPQMMGLPNRAPEPISRSWSFCANTVWTAHDPESCKTFWTRLMRKQVRMVIGNENDQVS